MKKFMNEAKYQITMRMLQAKLALESSRAEGFVNTAIKILMAVVIGALLLAGLYALFGETVLFSSRYSHDSNCYA